MLKPCSPICWTQPVITSSTSSAGMPARLITSLKALPDSGLERLAIAGAGTIAAGLAAAAAERGIEVVLWGRSERSLARARASLGEESPVSLTCDLDALCAASLAVEAVAEELDVKA